MSVAVKTLYSMFILCKNVYQKNIATSHFHLEIYYIIEDQREVDSRVKKDGTSSSELMDKYNK